jgi:hypothetical protein
MHIISTTQPAFKVRAPGEVSFTTVSLPAGAFNMAPTTRMSFTLYKRRVYGVGQLNIGLVYTEFEDLHQLGIEATSTAPTVALSAGTGITAVNIVYVYTMAELVGSVVVHESDISDESNVIEVANNQQLTVTGLPVTHANARVTHKRLYRSDNGGLFRHVANIALATSSYVDSTATLALGSLAPENHAVPPYCKQNDSYHDRLWYGIDPANPTYVWYSELGKPEAVGAANFLKTRDGEAVTGLKRRGDELLVFCARCVYSVKGYSEADFVMTKISPIVGCIAPHSIVIIDETLWFLSEIGVYMYDGAFHFMMEDLRDYFRDAYAADINTYQDSIAADDRYFNGYYLLIPKENAFYYYGHYLPLFDGESQPHWLFDYRDRKDRVIGSFTPASGAHRYDLYVGSANGFLYEANSEADSDDAGDTGNKQLIIQTGSLGMNDPGGNIENGKTLTKAWTYVKAESNAWTLYLTGGDEDVVNAHTPDNTTYFWKDSVAASAVASTTNKSVHNHTPERVSGRAFNLKIVADDPVDMSYRGFGGHWKPGPATRPAT